MSSEMYCDKCGNLIDTNEEYAECPECDRLLCEDCWGIGYGGHCEECENHL